jgi:hypothetical protein
MGKKLGLDKAYANLGKGYLQYPVINSVKPKPKPTKAMAGGMMQGYGAARKDGMGLQDEKVKPGKVQKAFLGLMALKKAKDKGAKGLELLSPIAMATKFFSKGGKIIKAKEGKMLSAKQKKIARMAPPPDKITGADFKAMKAKYGKMMKK